MSATYDNLVSYGSDEFFETVIGGLAKLDDDIESIDSDAILEYDTESSSGSSSNSDSNPGSSSDKDSIKSKDEISPFFSSEDDADDLKDSQEVSTDSAETTESPFIVSETTEIEPALPGGSESPFIVSDDTANISDEEKGADNTILGGEESPFIVSENDKGDEEVEDIKDIDNVVKNEATQELSDYISNEIVDDIGGMSEFITEGGKTSVNEIINNMMQLL